MKTKMLLLAALAGAAAMSANAGVSFNVTLGQQLPVLAPAPAVCAVPVAPVPVAAVQTVPACPGVNYVWVPGCWSFQATGHVWLPGAWQYRPMHAERRQFHDGHCWQVAAH